MAVSYALAAPEPDGTQPYGFALGALRPARPLVIDPATIVYAGFIGGGGNDEGQGIAVDSAGAAYVTGYTSSTEATVPGDGRPRPDQRRRHQRRVRGQGRPRRGQPGLRRLHRRHGQRRGPSPSLLTPPAPPTSPAPPTPPSRRSRWRSAPTSPTTAARRLRGQGRPRRGQPGLRRLHRRRRHRAGPSASPSTRPARPTSPASPSSTAASFPVTVGAPTSPTTAATTRSWPRSPPAGRPWSTPASSAAAARPGPRHRRGRRRRRLRRRHHRLHRGHLPRGGRPRPHLQRRSSTPSWPRSPPAGRPRLRRLHRRHRRRRGQRHRGGRRRRRLRRRHHRLHRGHLPGDGRPRPHLQRRQLRRVRGQGRPRRGQPALRRLSRRQRRRPGQRHRGRRRRRRLRHRLTNSTEGPATSRWRWAPTSPSNGGRDAFVAKVAPEGSAWPTPASSAAAGTDEGYGIAVDAAGAAYVTGATTPPRPPSRMRSAPTSSPTAASTPSWPRSPAPALAAGGGAHQHHVDPGRQPGAGAGTFTLTYGTRPLMPMFGDWDGNGSKTPATYEAGTVKLRNDYLGGAPRPRSPPASTPGASPWPATSTATAPTTSPCSAPAPGRSASAPGPCCPRSPSGPASWPDTVPVAGDWDGNGTDGIGTYDLATGTWNLRHTATPAPPTPAASCSGTAPARTTPWSATGTPTATTPWESRPAPPGRCATPMLPGRPDIAFNFGLANDLPLSWR